MCSYQLSIIILHLLHVCIDRFKYLGEGLGKMHDTRDRIVWFWEVQLVAQNIPHITLITTAHYSWPVSLAPGPVHRSSSQDTSPNVYISTAILPWVCRVVAFSPRLSGRAHCPFALTTTKYSVLSGRPAGPSLLNQHLFRGSTAEIGVRGSRPPPHHYPHQRIIISCWHEPLGCDGKQ